jgi:hypothetical protein
MVLFIFTNLSKDGNRALYNPFVHRSEHRRHRTLAPRGELHSNWTEARLTGLISRDSAMTWAGEAASANN